jgi:D-alanyl-D-alanine carboxypeptidase
MGTSAKLALERSVAGASRTRDLRPAHLLLGILSAQVGTVPRALALAGVDREGLASRVRRLLTD